MTYEHAIFVEKLEELALDKGVMLSWEHLPIHRILKLSFNFNNLVRHKILSDKEVKDCTDARALARRIIDDVWDDIKRHMNVPVELPNRAYITTGRGVGKTWIQEQMMKLDKEEQEAVFHHIKRIFNNSTDAFGRSYNMNIIKNSIKDVIFNPPATIVMWKDGTKTVVKAQNDEPFDAEKGLAMAIAKKALGNQGNYFETIKKYTEKYKEKENAEHHAEDLCR